MASKSKIILNNKKREIGKEKQRLLTQKLILLTQMNYLRKPWKVVRKLEKRQI
jgi:hypothetical protein